MSAPRIVVLGDLITDVIVRLQDDLAMVSDARAMIDLRPGGSGANQAAWLAYAGAEVDFVGVAGCDPMSMWSQSELDVLGVRTHLTQLHDESPGIVVALVDRQAERTMLTDRGANLKLRPEHVKVALFGAEAHFHLSGYLLLYEETRAAALHALKLAREAHMTVSVDPVAASLLERIGPANFIEWTRGATLCIPNESEAAVLTGEPTVERMIDALTQHYTEVVIKHGAAGSTWSRTGQKATHAPAPRVQAIDSTGAGDAFCAGFLAARLGGAEPRTALVEGNRLGALAVTQVGARPKHLP